MQHSCRHFDYTRQGGRASQRATDFVRRRLWRKKAGPADASDTASDGAQQAARSVASAVISPTTVMSGARSGTTQLHPCRARLTNQEASYHPPHTHKPMSQHVCHAGFASKQRLSEGKALCASSWACLRGVSSATRSGMLYHGILVHGQWCPWRKPDYTACSFC